MLYYKCFDYIKGCSYWYSYAPISGNPTIGFPSKSDANPKFNPALIAGEPEFKWKFPFVASMNNGLLIKFPELT